MWPPCGVQRARRRCHHRLFRFVFLTSMWCATGSSLSPPPPLSVRLLGLDVVFTGLDATTVSLGTPLWPRHGAERAQHHRHRRFYGVSLSSEVVCNGLDDVASSAAVGMSHRPSSTWCATGSTPPPPQPLSVHLPDLDVVCNGLNAPPPPSPLSFRLLDLGMWLCNGLDAVAITASFACFGMSQWAQSGVQPPPPSPLSVRILGLDVVCNGLDAACHHCLARLPPRSQGGAPWTPSQGIM